MRVAGRRELRFLFHILGLLMLPGLLALVPSSASAEGAKVLILDSTVTDGLDSVEARAVSAAGFVPEVVTAEQWRAKSQAQFASYAALVLGDATCGEVPPDVVAETADTWGPAVTGNVLVNGTDPVYHWFDGGQTLVEKSIGFALSDTARTGFYASLSCYFHGTNDHTPVKMLDGLRPGGFTVRGVGCYDDAHIVAQHPALDGLTDADLSGWACSVHEAFDSWPSDYTVLAMARDIGETFTASDGSVGTPYILARSRNIRSFPLSVNKTFQVNDVSGQAVFLTTLLDAETSKPAAGVPLAGIVTAGPQSGRRLTCAVPCDSSPEGEMLFTLRGEDSGDDSVLIWVDTDRDRNPDVGEAQVSALARWRSKYDAMGDSFSSGEGNSPFLKGTDTATDRCHRSQVAYSKLLTPRFPTTTPLNFVACSGATTADFTGKNPTNREGAQLDRIRPAASAVSFSVGGNDVGFSDILTQCIYTDHVIKVLNKVTGKAGCNARQAVYSPAYRRIRALRFGGDVKAPDGRKIVPLPTLLRRVAKAAPRAEIYVAGYPRLFEDLESNSRKSCVVGTTSVLGSTVKLRLRHDDIAWMNETTELLDKQIRNAVSDARNAGVRAHYVNPLDEFADKGLCGPHESWIYGLLLNSDRGPRPASFHPTKAGQRAYEKAFASDGIFGS